LGLLGANQQRQGANANARAIGQGVDYARGMYTDAQGNLAPYMQFGQGAGGLGGLSRLAAGDYSGFETSPDYMYTRGEMVKGLDRSAAAHLRLNAGGYPVELAGQLNGLASQNLGNYRNSLQWGAQLGQGSAMGLGQLGASSANTVMNGYAGLGDARQSAYGASAGGLMGLGNMFGRWMGTGG
jgi:hypothetical protein